MIDDDEMWDKQQDYSYMWRINISPDEDWGYDVCLLEPFATNLATAIYLDDTMQFRKQKFDPAIIIVPATKNICVEYTWDRKLIPVTISENPKIIIPDNLFQAKNELTQDEWNEIFDFIARNRDVLLAHWNGTLEEDFDVDTPHDALKVKMSNGNIVTGLIRRNLF